jgi:hypothetical protein
MTFLRLGRRSLRPFSNCLRDEKCGASEKFHDLFCCTAVRPTLTRSRGTGTGLGGSQGEPRQLDGKIRTAFSI